jgi:tRNA A37 threonylcarbamoyladenosine biosynthesis protein TsaE
LPLPFAEFSESNSMALIPVTILTGFLGSGKTTLLKRVLSESTA